MTWRWMTRLVDPVGAVAARGWPPGVAGTVPLELHDPVWDDRTGRYVAEMGEFGGRWVKNYDGHDQSGADYKTLDESIAIRMRKLAT